MFLRTKFSRFRRKASKRTQKLLQLTANNVKAKALVKVYKKKSWSFYEVVIKFKLSIFDN